MNKKKYKKVLKRFSRLMNDFNELSESDPESSFDLMARMILVMVTEMENHGIPTEVFLDYLSNLKPDTDIESNIIILQ